VFGQAIRSLIEGLLPAGFGRWVEAARAWRRQGDHLGATLSERRRFWERFTDLALRQAERPPTESDLDQLLADVRAGTSQSGPSQPVAIIDVASGGAEALTLGTVRVLRSADIIFFDQDVPATVLEFARREALRQPIPLDDARSRAAIAIADEILAAVGEGKRVVRLRVADMLNAVDVSSEAEQLADMLRAAGLHVAVIPAGRSASDSLFFHGIGAAWLGMAWALGYTPAGGPLGSN
jgi:uroporphyrin-III C-methyltransferase/precorrin-2 dehydrogenase/sirohydrochlorin ferrochelatase